MKAVIQSDIYCSKVFIVFYLIFTLIFVALACVGLPPYLTLFPFAMFNFVLFQRTQVGENCGWEKYLDASGVSRKEQVAARFLESAAVNLCTAAVFAAAMTVNTLFVKEDNILSPAQIFMFVALEIFVGAVYSLLIAIHYTISDAKIRGSVYFIFFISTVFLPQIGFDIPQPPSTYFTENNTVLCGAALLGISAAIYVGLYKISVLRFRKKEMQ